MNNVPISTFALFTAWANISLSDKLRILDALVTEYPATTTQVANTLAINLNPLATEQTDTEFIKEINGHVIAGRRVEPIKLVQERYKIVLKEAKRALDYATVHPNRESWTSLTAQEQDIVQALQNMGITLTSV